MRITFKFTVAALALAGWAVMTAAPAAAKCTRMGFTVNDYGKDGPTKDAKDLLDKHVAKWAAEKGVTTYKIGAKDVKCELFLNLILFDEHTCTASASVCWDEGPAAAKPVTDAAAPAGDAKKTDAAKAADDKPKTKAADADKAADTQKEKSEKSDSAPAVTGASPVETGTIPDAAKDQSAAPVADPAAAEKAAAAAERAADAAERAAAAAERAQAAAEKTVAVAPPAPAVTAPPVAAASGAAAPAAVAPVIPSIPSP